MAYCFSVGKVLSWGASIRVYDVFLTAWIIRTSRGKRLQGMSRYVQWWESRAKIKYGSPVWPQLTVYLIRAPDCSAHMIWMTCGRGEDSMSCTVIGLLSSPNFGKLRQTSANFGKRFFAGPECKRTHYNTRWRSTPFFLKYVCTYVFWKLWLNPLQSLCSRRIIQYPFVTSRSLSKLRLAILGSEL